MPNRIRYEIVHRTYVEWDIREDELGPQQVQEVMNLTKQQVLDIAVDMEQMPRNVDPHDVEVKRVIDG